MYLRCLWACWRLALIIFNLRLIDFFNFVRTQCHRCTCNMVESKVGYHRCDVWVFFKDYSAFKAHIMMDLSISWMAIMFKFDIILLLIFDWIALPLLKRSCCSTYFIECILYLWTHLKLFARSSLFMLVVNWCSRSLKNRAKSISMNKPLWSNVVIMSNGRIPQCCTNGVILFMHNM